MFCVAALSLTACEKCIIEESSVADDEPSKLFISTRAAAANDGGDADGEISYPVNVYVFDEDGACVATKSIESSEEPLELNVPAGDYDVYAVAGADEEDYDIPSKDEATTYAVMTLKEGHEHGDLMTANGSVKMVYGEENKLTLELARKVMMLESVTIEDVPENVTAVSVSLSPLRENLLLNGDYEGTNGIYETDLQKDADGTTWKSSQEVYLLEAAGPATVKVSFTTQKEEEEKKVDTYSFECSDELKANHKINISGSFGANNSLKMEGVMTGATWEASVDIPLDFKNGESETTDDSNSDTTIGEGTGEIPSVGTLYKGCYVLKSEDTGSKTIVTLMSTETKNALTYEYDGKDKQQNQISMEAAIEKTFKSWSTNIENGPVLRLPTLDELLYVAENLDFINSKLDEYEKSKLEIENNYGRLTYFYLTEDGEISTYSIKSKLSYPNPTSDKKSLYLRGFATLSFSK